MPCEPSFEKGTASIIPLLCLDSCFGTISRPFSSTEGDGQGWEFFPRVFQKPEQSSSLQLCKISRPLLTMLWLFQNYVLFDYFKNAELQVPWHVISITTKPYQHSIIVPEGTQQGYLLEERSFAPAASLGKPTPDSLQRPSWTGGFCGMPGISPDLDHFTASGCWEQLQSLGTAAGNILPALPCLFS